MENFKTKAYLHFDNRIDYSQVKSRVENPNWVKKHGFFPFIHKKKILIKYIGGKHNPTKQKIRDLYRASHIDSCIYTYYAEQLTEKYDKSIAETGIDNNVAGYRKNKGKSNINYAAEAIGYIAEKDESYVLLGDFKHFFDTLDHRYLKKQWQKVIGCSELPSDWYQIFRSLTKFSWVDQSELNKIFGSEREQYKGKMVKYFNSTSDFQEFKTRKKIYKNEKFFGIPQGTAISALLSNVYMINFDQWLADLADAFGGKYLRYADDFMLVLPANKVSRTDFEKIVNKIVLFAKNETKLTIQKEKTEIYRVANNEVYRINENGGTEKSMIDYLGFVFDGKNVKMRQKSVSKFYRKAYKAIEIAKIRTIKKKSEYLIGKKGIYRYYSDLGERDNPRFGNFISYAKRCQRIFDQTSPNTNNLMMEQMKNRQKKLAVKMRTSHEQI